MELPVNSLHGYCSLASEHPCWSVDLRHIGLLPEYTVITLRPIVGDEPLGLHYRYAHVTIFAPFQVVPCTTNDLLLNTTP